MAGPREWSPRGKIKKFTLIGYWKGTNDPWLAFGEGLTPEEGMLDALKRNIEMHTWPLEFMKNLVVLEIIAGHHRGLLENEEVFSGYEALTGKWEY